MFRRWFLPRLVWWLYRLWTWTWRVQVVCSDATRELIKTNPPLIFAHWHGDELAIVPLVTEYRIATMTSTSADGALIDFVIRKLGGATSRGSSTRGAVSALKGLVRLVRQGYRASMAVDGPKGPLHKVKPGVFELSFLAKAYIIPTAAASNRAKVFAKSWNKARLPLPFAHVVVTFGSAISPISESENCKNPELRDELAHALVDASGYAAKLVAENKSQMLASKGA